MTNMLKLTIIRQEGMHNLAEQIKGGQCARLLKMVIIMKPGLQTGDKNSAITSQLGRNKAWTHQTGDGNYNETIWNA
jgi:hypothetical protein